jgi:hypothetical protein
MVTFEPGARTTWHTHPLGQTLLIVSELGWVQREGALSRRRGPVMWCGFRRGSSTGTARQRQAP